MEKVEISDEKLIQLIQGELSETEFNRLSDQVIQSSEIEVRMEQIKKIKREFALIEAVDQKKKSRHLIGALAACSFLLLVVVISIHHRMQPNQLNNEALLSYEEIQVENLM